MSPSLYEDWLEYMKHIKSPDCFIRLGFYFMIGAALQRRVWFGPTEAPIFPNLYIILCGPPGVGKGLVIKQVIEFLRYHKLIAHNVDNTEIANFDKMLVQAKEQGLDGSVIEKIQNARLAVQEIYTISQTNNSPFRDKLLFTIAPDSATHEALVSYNAKNFSKIVVAPCSMAPSGVYIHHSITFTLEELSSLFKKRTENLVNFLLKAYDCGDYEYQTLSRGPELLKKPCLSFFAGTTPVFMQESFDDKLLNDGFASRTIFTYAPRNRKNTFGIPEFDSCQIEAKHRILTRLKRLSQLFGPVKMTDEATAFCSNYFEKILPENPENDSPRLEAYYARKDIHLMKIAMCIHFANNDDMVIELDEARKALNLLNELEPLMHLALTFTGRNPLAQISKKIIKWINKQPNPVSFMNIFSNFYEDLKGQMELEELLNYYIGMELVDIIEGTPTRYKGRTK